MAEPYPGQSFCTFSSNLYYLSSPPHLTPLRAAGLASSSLDCTCADHPPAWVPHACSEASLPYAAPCPPTVAGPWASPFGGLLLPPASLEHSPHSSQSPSLWIALLFQSVCWASFSSTPRYLRGPVLGPLPCSILWWCRPLWWLTYVPQADNSSARCSSLDVSTAFLTVSIAHVTCPRPDSCSSSPALPHLSE